MACRIRAQQRGTVEITPDIEPPPRHCDGRNGIVRVVRHDGRGRRANAQSQCAPTSPQTGAKFNFWHPALITLHFWIWYPNPAGIYSNMNPLVATLELELFSATGRRIFTGTTAAVPGHAEPLEVVLSQRLPRGAYTVSWHSVSAIDGHYAFGSFPSGCIRLETWAGRHGPRAPNVAPQRADGGYELPRSSQTDERFVAARATDKRR